MTDRLFILTECEKIFLLFVDLKPDRKSSLILVHTVLISSYFVVVIVPFGTLSLRPIKHLWQRLPAFIKIRTQNPSVWKTRLHRFVWLQFSRCGFVSLFDPLWVELLAGVVSDVVLLWCQWLSNGTKTQSDIFWCCCWNHAMWEKMETKTPRRLLKQQSHKINILAAIK